MADLALLKIKNDRRWLEAKNTGRLNFTPFAKKAVANKQRYLDIVHRLQRLGSNMPDDAWVFIAIVHNRECSMDFTCHLGQGDPLDKVTVHVPAGRGPFTGPDAFEKGAVDALWYCAPYAARNNKDWSVSGMLTYFERYNGLAYANANRPSPYVWSGTTVYDPPTGPGGKVVVDHGPIANVVDKQLGCAGMLLAIEKLDDTIDFGNKTAEPDVDLKPIPNVYDTVWLQDALNKLGAAPQLVVDGINGTATKTAVRAFQKSHKLKVDGIAGTVETIPAIIQALENKA